jgi:hypothetical protein
MLVELSARYISGAPHHPAQWTPTVRKGGRSHVVPMEVSDGHQLCLGEELWALWK